MRAVVRGRVQGVFFRDYTRVYALTLGVHGYVRNAPDGTVEVEAEGERPALEKLLAHLKKGPPRASVEDVAVIWSRPTGKYDGFGVKY